MGLRHRRFGERVIGVWAVVNWLGIALGLVLVATAVVLTILAISHH
jgi:hypothetical protein